MAVRLAGIAVLVVTLFVVAGCRDSTSGPKPPEAFCEAATRYDKRVQKGAKLPEQIRLVEKMTAAAPAKIKPDSETFLDALRRVATDPSVRDNPDIQRAVENVNRYAAQGCGFYERRPGGGI
jgi:hypothetical protein